MQTYANVCKEYAKNMLKYAILCEEYAKVCRNMQCILTAKICKLYAYYMQKHAKYAITIFICIICKHMHWALHSSLCWWHYQVVLNDSVYELLSKYDNTTIWYLFAIFCILLRNFAKNCIIPSLVQCNPTFAQYA